jgi:DNA-binding protein YbaB
MPDMDAALQQAQLAQSSLEDFMHGMNTGTFTGADDARTVEVTINGRQWLTDLYIEDGLLRLGAETVGARLNEAVGNAQAAATASSSSNPAPKRSRVMPRAASGPAPAGRDRRRASPAS